MGSFDLGSLAVLPAGVSPTFSDGLVGALSQDQSVFITSPTSEYIPQFELGILTVQLRDDGRFGLADPLNAAQIFSPSYPYPCAILRRVPEHDPLAVMWKCPSAADFVENQGSVVRGLGRLSKAFLDAFNAPLSEMVHRAKRASSHSDTGDRAEHLEHLEWYIVAMRQAYDRLRYMPASFRDQVIQVVQLQRYWLLTHAYLEYYARLRAVPTLSSPTSTVANSWMGTWTTDPSTVQHLMVFGIPVWFLRTLERMHADIRVGALVIVQEARHLTSMPFFGEESLYHGLPGDKHLETTMRPCDTYRDLSRVPAPSLFLSDDYACGLSKSQTPQYQSEVRPGPSNPGVVCSAPSRLSTSAAYAPYPNTKPGKPHPSQVRGRDKFAEFTHPWMPAAIPTWMRAMQTVDRTEKARAANDTWGYWIPEPAILISPKDAAKVERHVLNWLRARPNWLYLLRVPGSAATRVGTQAWRQFLNGVSNDGQEQTRVGRRNFAIRQIFGDLFAEADFSGTHQGSVDWQGYSVSSLTDVLAPKIVWETFELGFRYELLAVERFLWPQHSPRDRALQEYQVGQVFPEGVVLAVPSLPTLHSHGVFAAVPHWRVKALNAFKALLHRWPGCPSMISQQEPLQISDTQSVIEEVEFNLACFYVNTFFQLSGRAPIVPHLFPL